MTVERRIEVDFPEWAMCYFVYADPTGLDQSDVHDVDEWWTSMKEDGYTDVEFTDERSEFTRYPEFGLACSTVKANVLRLV